MALYCQISRGGCIIHLTEHYGDCCPGSTVHIRVTGIEDYHPEITSKGYGRLGFNEDLSEKTA